MADKWGDIETGWESDEPIPKMTMKEWADRIAPPTTRDTKIVKFLRWLLSADLAEREVDVDLTYQHHIIPMAWQRKYLYKKGEIYVEKQLRATRIPAGLYVWLLDQWAYVLFGFKRAEIR